MDDQTIKFLNQLNSDFYQTVAHDFSDTRSVSWEGWQKLLPFLNNNFFQDQLLVLDVGCGNGRFFEFLKQAVVTPAHPQNFKYWGVDNSSDLLKLAAQKLDAVTSEEAAFINLDMVNSLLEDNFTQELENIGTDFNLITLFGVLHHIPSFELRRKLIKDLAKLLPTGGLLVVTNWQFTHSESLLKRAVSPQEIKLDAEKIDDDDYILDWQRGENQQAYRYCHLTSDQEMEELIKDAGVKVLSQYQADKYNHYFVLQKD